MSDINKKPIPQSRFHDKDVCTIEYMEKMFIDAFTHLKPLTGSDIERYESFVKRTEEIVCPEK